MTDHVGFRPHGVAAADVAVLTAGCSSAAYGQGWFLNGSAGQARWLSAKGKYRDKGKYREKRKYRDKGKRKYGEKGRKEIPVGSSRARAGAGQFRSK